MERIIIEGGARLIGDVPISGSKNSALPLFAASILCGQANTFHGVPDLRDVATIQRVLRNLGVRVVEKAPGSVEIDSSVLSGHEAPYDLV